MLITFAILAYLFGSIPFGKIVGLRFGVNIQKEGSGNIGFANVFRVLGLKPALAVLSGDILKGYLPTLIAAKFLSFEQTLLVGFISILGHIFPVWLKFRGGKGVATGLGVLLMLNSTLALISILIWLVIFGITRLNSLASIITVWVLPLVAYKIDQNLINFCIILLILGTWTHRSNFYRLINRKEERLF